MNDIANLGVEELRRQLETSRVTNRRLNRRCQLAEKELDRQLRLVGGMANQLKHSAERVRVYAQKLRGEEKALRRELNLTSGSEAALKSRIVELDRQVLRLHTDSYEAWSRRVRAEDEVRRLQAENHELRMCINELEGSKK